MNSQTIVMCVVALILGMLLANMLKSVCGCKVIEGQHCQNNQDCPGSMCSPLTNQCMVARSQHMFNRNPFIKTNQHSNTYPPCDPQGNCPTGQECYQPNALINNGIRYCRQIN